MTLVNVRAANPDDITAMHRIRVAVRENRLGDPLRVRPEDYRRRLRPTGIGFVAESGGRIVGFAVADSEHASIWALFVDPRFEGRGIGRRLHDTLVTAMFATGAAELRLSTDPDTRAERLYRAAGWAPTGGTVGGELCYRLTRDCWNAG